MQLQNITALQIGDVVFDNLNFILQEISGLESPTVRLPRYNLPGQSGAFISNALYGERAIKIKGVVNSPDGTRATYINNRSTLINNMVFKRDVDGNLIPIELNLSLANGQNITTEVFMDGPIEMGYSLENTDFEEFLITMICPDPNMYSSIQSITNINLPIGGGTVIPTPIPVSLAVSSGGSAAINNTGSNTAFPIITFTAPLTNPFIANNSTNQFIKLNYDIALGAESVIINCANQTILQGGTSLTAYMTQDSTFFGIISGINNMGFSAASGTGTVQVSFYPSYLGV